MLLVLDQLAFAMLATGLSLKLMLNRLREVMGKINSPFQSDFVKGRMITYNYIVAHVVLQSLI